MRFRYLKKILHKMDRSVLKKTDRTIMKLIFVAIEVHEGLIVKTELL